MLVVSEFHDYYDCIQSSGIDKSVVYNRVERTASGVNDFLKCGYDIANGRCFLTVNYFTVGFCGEIHFGVHFECRHKYHSHNDFEVDECVYSVDEFLNLIKGLPQWVEKSMLKKRKNGVRGRFPGDYQGAGIRDIELFFKENKKVMDDSLFIKHGSPLFIYEYSSCSGNRLSLNCSLDRINFARVYDPYQAYQRIYQYLSGVLGKDEVETVNISDECMRDKKGFNDRSFRMDKGVKKPRRRGR